MIYLVTLLSVNYVEVFQSLYGDDALGVTYFSYKNTETNNSRINHLMWVTSKVSPFEIYGGDTLDVTMSFDYLFLYKTFHL